MKTFKLESISASECCLIVGGADKSAQNALYYIGFALGFIIRCIARLFVANEPQVSTI